MAYDTRPVPIPRPKRKKSPAKPMPRPKNAPKIGDRNEANMRSPYVVRNGKMVLRQQLGNFASE